MSRSRQRRQARQHPIGWIALPLLLATAAPAADVPVGDEPKPHIVVPRVDRAPELDDFLEMEPAPDLVPQMVRVEGLIQRNPEDGEPASQETHVYLGYDSGNLYVVFVAFDDEPDQVRAHLARRERVFLDDTVEIMLDTFHDKRRAFAFLTNPLGIQWDALWTEGEGFDGAWDTVWQSRGRLTDRGYVVWMAIPFKSLRFPPTGEQTWGLIVVRDIVRNNETSFWPRVSSRIEGRLNQAATLGGLEGISPGRNVQLIPYGTARTSRTLDAANDQFVTDDLDLDAGLDAKLVFRDRIALDLTANPDFSQVESDLPQVTVNQRFEVFFPERRPFFLENADYFSTPFNLLFTRRITEPRLGARTTGKVGKYAVGALLIDDETPADSDYRGEIAANGVVRVDRDLFEQSTIGFMYTQRTSDSRNNRVGGLDGRFKLGDNWNTSFQAVYGKTQDRFDEAGGETVDLDDLAWQAVLDRVGRRTNWHLHYTDIGKEFQTDLGFVPRTDLRNFHQRIAYDFWPEGPKLIKWGPSLFGEYIADQNGTRLDWNVEPEIEFEYRRRTSFQLFARVGRERLRPEDLPLPEQAPEDGLDFPRSRYGFSFDTAYLQSVEGSVGYFQGESINFSPADGGNPTEADETRLTIDLILRPGRHLRIDNRYLLSQLDDEATGRRVFRNQILRTRWNYQFSPRLSLRFILEYDSIRPESELTTLERGRNLNGDVLLTYLVNPWTAVYAGYNGNHRSDEELRGTTEGEDGEMVNDSREAFVKVSYLFRF